jgi:superfamily I DNA and/or RNA helicase
MLKRLADAQPDAVQQLKHQYRMHPEICKLASDAIYDGKLVPAIQVPVLKLPGFPKTLNSQTFGNACHWLKRVLNPFRPVVFANTDDISASTGHNDTTGATGTSVNDKTISSLERSASRETGGAMVNDTEATLVRLSVHGLIATGMSPSSIGIICPFRAQVCCILSDINPTSLLALIYLLTSPDCDC